MEPRTARRRDESDQYLGLAGRVERLRGTDSNHHLGGDALSRWQNLHREEIARVIDRRDELKGRDGPGVSSDRLTLWILEAIDDLSQGRAV